MALIYEARRGSSYYRVTRAGGSRRLYKNGIFHTQYNPGSLFTGSVWDMLSVPVCYAQTAPQTALLLGVGGGSAVHQLRRLIAPTRILGVEIDPLHLHIGKRFFDLRGDDLTLVEADAVEWISRHRRQRFDLVIDDVFIESEQPLRPLSLGEDWLERVSSLVGPRGILIQNHARRADVKALLSRYADWLGERFSSVLLFEPERCGNAVLVAFREPASARRRQSVNRLLRSRFGAQADRLAYRVSRLLGSDRGV